MSHVNQICLFFNPIRKKTHNPRYLFETVAKLTKKKKASSPEVSKQHSSIMTL